MPLFIMHRAGLASIRRRPVNSALGVTVRHLLILLACVLVSRASAEELQATVPVTTRDAYGAVVEAGMPVTVFRPSTAGRLAAVILSHGRPGPAQRGRMGRVKLSSVSTTLLGMGLVVIVPTRIGYGIASGPDPEFTVSCEQPRYFEALAAVADQISAAVSYARSLPFVDPDRVFLVGHSVGGAGTVAATVRNLPGVRASVAFNSGHGGRPLHHPGEPCAPGVLQSAFAKLGSAHSAIPLLWIHSEGDRTVSMAHAQNWFNAFATAGGRGEFRAFPAYRDDSHEWFASQPGQWRDTVRAFFEANGRAP